MAVTLAELSLRKNTGISIKMSSLRFAYSIPWMRSFSLSSEISRFISLISLTMSGNIDV